MKKNFAILGLILFCFAFFLISRVYSVNFLNSYDSIDNSRLSSYDRDDNLKTQTSNHIISVTTVSEIEDGAIRILVSAKDNSTLSNDGHPDQGEDTASSGFDLNGITSTDVECSLEKLDKEFETWFEPVIITSSESKSGEHEILCPYKGKIKSSKILTIKIGGPQKKLINPLPSKNHKEGQADIYPLAVHHLAKSGNIVDRIILKVALIDEVTTGIGQLGVGAQVDKYRFVIFGLTSPKGVVTLDGPSVRDRVIADDKGNFTFSKPSPLVPQELCLITRDSQRRISPPVCLPPFPVDYDTNIGPVLMPPTLSLGKGNFWVGQDASLTGQTIPGIRVKLSLFRDDKSSLTRLNPIKTALAYSLPELEIYANSKGNFSSSLPSTESTSFNLFAQSYYTDDPTPKSLTLRVTVLPLWKGLWNLNLAFLALLTRRLAELIILFVLSLLAIFVIKRYFHPEKIAFLHRNQLLKRQKFEIIPWSPNRAIVKKKII